MGWNTRLVLIAVGAASVPLADYTVEHLVRDDAVVAQSRDARTRLLQEIRLRSALDGAVVTDSGWTIEVSEDWFRSPPAPPAAARGVPLGTHAPPRATYGSPNARARTLRAGRA